MCGVQIIAVHDHVQVHELTNYCVLTVVCDLCTTQDQFQWHATPTVSVYSALHLDSCNSARAETRVPSAESRDLRCALGRWGRDKDHITLRRYLDQNDKRLDSSCTRRVRRSEDLR